MHGPGQSVFASHPCSNGGLGGAIPSPLSVAARMLPQLWAQEDSPRSVPVGNLRPSVLRSAIPRGGAQFQLGCSLPPPGLPQIEVQNAARAGPVRRFGGGGHRPGRRYSNPRPGVFRSAIPRGGAQFQLGYDSILVNRSIVSPAPDAADRRRLYSLFQHVPDVHFPLTFHVD